MPEPHLYAVIIDHTPQNCPLRQSTPQAAINLANNLEKIETHGVFSMQLHHGVDLVKAESPKELSAQYAAVLPNHKPVFIIDVTDDKPLQQIYEHASLLDTDESMRRKLLSYIADHISFINFRLTEERDLPTRSLRTLPAFLRENAPRRAKHSFARLLSK
jgi:hypothetical protein